MTDNIDEIFYCIESENAAADLFDEEVVIVNFATGKYFSLGGIGPFIWSLLETPNSVRSIVSTVSQTYKVSEQTAESDVAPFVASLAKERLIVRTQAGADQMDGNDTGSVAGSAGPNGSYVPPSMDVFDDLQSLIVLDPIHETDPDKGWPATDFVIRRE